MGWAGDETFKGHTANEIMEGKDTSWLKGVGKDEPIVVNEEGGKQSKVLYRF